MQKNNVEKMLPFASTAVNLPVPVQETSATAPSSARTTKREKLFVRRVKIQIL